MIMYPYCEADENPCLTCLHLDTTDHNPAGWRCIRGIILAQVDPKECPLFEPKPQISG